MNEKTKAILGLFLALAVAAILAVPFVPVFAFDAETKTVYIPPTNEWEVTSLDISKDVDSVTAAGTEVSLEKTASQSALAMEVGETKEISFTIQVGAQSSNAYSISGDIFVENTGEWPADVTAVSDTVWYKAGGPTWLAAASNITTTVPTGDGAISKGQHTYSYSGTFTLPVPLASVTAMSNLIEITISNKPDPPPPGMKSHKFHFRQDFEKPAAGSTVVELEDEEAITPSPGLSYVVKSVTINGSAAALSAPWSLDLAGAPFTVVITKDLTASAAGTYILNNRAFIGQLEDEAEVEIVVTEPEKELGSITGYKYMDENANGELDESEDPWEGITIELWKDGTKVAETATNAEGMFFFGGLEAGDYTVKEVLPDGVANSGPLSIDVALDEGEHEVLEQYFLNYYIPVEDRLGSILGYKYEDLDADGVLEDGEPPFAGITIELWRHDEAVEVSAATALQLLLDGAWYKVAETVTAADGSYFFDDLAYGEYVVKEVLPEGVFASGPLEIAASVGNIQDVIVEIPFLNYRLGEVVAHKWLDVNGDGIREEGEPPLEGVKMVLSGGEEFEAEAVTDADGEAVFAGLRPGAYLIRESVPDGFYATGPVEVGVILASGERREADFLNTEYGAVEGRKWLDANANGKHDEGESGLEGVTIRLRDAGGQVIATAATDKAGAYGFEGLRAGGYSVEEIVPAGYKATSAAKVLFTLRSGEVEEIDFHNAAIEVAGETVAPPAEPEAAKTLPKTGIDLSYLLILVGAAVLLGAAIASFGLARSVR